MDKIIYYKEDIVCMIKNEGSILFELKFIEKYKDKLQDLKIVDINN